MKDFCAKNGKRIFLSTLVFHTVHMRNGGKLRVFKPKNKKDLENQG